VFLLNNLVSQYSAHNLVSQDSDHNLFVKSSHKDKFEFSVASLFDGMKSRLFNCFYLYQLFILISIWFGMVSLLLSYDDYSLWLVASQLVIAISWFGLFLRLICTKFKGYTKL
jgi:hypothetical protein